MPLGPGTRLGPYEIVSAIGAGGMGEVYRAKDTRLDRTVAIKVLPSHVSGDAALRERFEREARTVAGLSHPHICTLHDVGHQDGTDFLVMEYLDGETLAHRLNKGALPLDQALAIGIQIADALDKAHRAGIVHRDLKPANIMLTKSGAKLLDFGLAKITPAGVAASGLSIAPTGMSPVTMQGTILGTLQYMAPEQVEGQDADARTDIFAFGAVLYEMVTGRRAFEGKSQASVIAAILEREPPAMSSLQPLTPPAFDHVVRRCLTKSADERWQSARDLTQELKWTAESAAQAGVTSPSMVRRRYREHLAWLIASLSVATVIVAVPVMLYIRPTVSERLTTRFDVVTPPTNDPTSFALSPDGRELAFVATFDGTPRIWVRSLDRLTAQPLTGTEEASHPFWAPDGRAMGFFAAGKLKRIDLAGGPAQVLADAPAERGGTWNGDGVIVFAPITFGPLMRVAATGGTPVPVTRVEPGEGSHRWPQFLPDGRRFLFFVGFGSSGRSVSGSATRHGVYIGTLDGGPPTRVLEAETAAMYAPPNSLLFVRDGVLVALGFDPIRGAVVASEPTTVAQGVGSEPGVARGTFAVSATGVLAHRSAGGERRQLVWADRTGKVIGTLGAADENALGNPELTIDGGRVAVQRAVQGNVDVWLIDVGRGVPTRFTFDAAADGDPVWSPDGTRVAFRSTRSDKAVLDLFEKPASSTADEQTLLATSQSKTPLAWSPDGRFLLYVSQETKTGMDLWALPVVANDSSTGPTPVGRTELRKAFPVAQTPFEETAGQFSPDGKWVAFESNESGAVEVYVQPFPGPGGKWQVSVAGGSQARWRPDGQELFYVAPDGRLMAATIRVEATLQKPDIGAPVALFATRLGSGSGITGVARKPQYAVAPDGRFLMNVAVEQGTASPISVVLNWDSMLPK
jgi:serine/threonine protein kinase